jgi:hypothetical protein
MVMVTPGHAARAAATLRNKLSARWWLRSVDFESAQDGYVVRVRVSRVATDVNVAVPAEVNGVRVELTG